MSSPVFVKCVYFILSCVHITVSLRGNVQQVTDVVRLGETDTVMDKNGYADAALPPSTLHFGCIVRQAGMFDSQARATCL